MINQKPTIRKPKNRTLGHTYGGWIMYQLSLINVRCSDIAVRFEAWIYEDVLPSIHKTGGYAIEKTESLEELHDLLKRSERSLKFLTTERAYLSRENRLLRENIKLRDKLAKKNTPLTTDEKAQIHALSDRMSASAIGSVLGRSESAVRRVLKQEKDA